MLKNISQGKSVFLIQVQELADLSIIDVILDYPEVLVLTKLEHVPTGHTKNEETLEIKHFLVVFNGVEQFLFQPLQIQSI